MTSYPQDIVEKRRLGGRHPALRQGHNPVHAGRQIGIMGGDQGGPPGALDHIKKHLKYLFGGARVEVTGWFIGQ
jgi:hypothetical protein